MTLLIKAGEGLGFAQGVDLKAIQSKADLFIKDVKEMGKRCDEITIAHALYIAKQQHWVEGGKGNTEAAGQWMIQLYQNNKNWYDNAVKFYRKVLGLSFRVHRDDDSKENPSAECTVVLFESRDHATNKLALAGRLVAAYDNGISYDTTGNYGKLSLPKKEKSSKGGKGTDAPSNTIELSKGQVMASDLGIEQVLGGATDEQAKNLKEIQGLLQAILEHAKSNPDRNGVKQLLESTVNKLNKGFTLGAAMKAVA